MINYKILRLSGVHYSAVLTSLIDAFPNFIHLDYQTQLGCLFQHKALYSDSFSKSMRKLGHDSHEIIWDLEVVQKRWAEEYAVPFSEETWMLDILLEQIRVLRPEVIYFQGTELCISGRFSDRYKVLNLATILKTKFSFIRQIVMFSGYPSHVSRVEDVDILFSGTPAIADHYQRSGIESTLCYHAFDEDVISKVDFGSPSIYDVTFVGSTQAPGERYWVLRELLARTPIHLWIDSVDEEQARKMFFVEIWKTQKSSLREMIKGWLRKMLEISNRGFVEKLAQIQRLPVPLKNVLNEIIKGAATEKRTTTDKKSKIVKRLPPQTLSAMYPDRCSPPVTGMDYYNILKYSRISFNKHTDRSMGTVGNLRLFEATGMGSCLLSDGGTNIRELFEPDYEIVIYNSVDEVVEKIDYLLNNEHERRTIAEAGQRKTLKSHTIFNRCQLIDEVIRSSL